jgi:hypothetical protein
MDRYPSAGDRGLTGDLQTGALVTTGGTVDWFCCPRSDAPSVFASLATPGSVFTCRRHSGARTAWISRLVPAISAIALLAFGLHGKGRFDPLQDRGPIGGLVP